MADEMNKQEERKETERDRQTEGGDGQKECRVSKRSQSAY